jgi:hypothetical protein
MRPRLPIGLAYSCLRSVEEVQILLIDRHIFTERNRRRSGAANEMHPAPRFAGGVKFFDDRLVMLERVHLGEVVVAHDFAETRDQSLRVVAALHILLRQLRDLFLQLLKRKENSF